MGQSHEGAMMRVVEGIEIRPAHVERDAALIRSLDTSFETGAILDVQAVGRFRLAEKTVEPPLRRRLILAAWMRRMSGSEFGWPWMGIRRSE